MHPCAPTALPIVVAGCTLGPMGERTRCGYIVKLVQLVRPGLGMDLGWLRAGRRRSDADNRQAPAALRACAGADYAVSDIRICIYFVFYFVLLLNSVVETIHRKSGCIIVFIVLFCIIYYTVFCIVEP